MFVFFLIQVFTYMDEIIGKGMGAWVLTQAVQHVEKVALVTLRYGHSMLTGSDGGMQGFLMTPLPDAQLTHVGLYVKDIDSMKAFYTGLLDMVVSDEGSHTGRELVFLTRNAEEHHQLVL